MIGQILHYLYYESFNSNSWSHFSLLMKRKKQCDSKDTCLIVLLKADWMFYKQLKVEVNNFMEIKNSEANIMYYKRSRNM